MEIFTIGFTGRTAEDFFETLRRAGIRRLIDTRLKNTSQLAAFAKRDDLAYFLRAILGAEYHAEPLLAPTKELLEGYRKGRIAWDVYEEKYLGLMEERDVAHALDRALFEEPAVLLCSERTAERCHRRLAAEHLAARWGGVRVVHL
jgi:uncharacterized protein (DUF488 family)